MVARSGAGRVDRHDVTLARIVGSTDKTRLDPEVEEE